MKKLKWNDISSRISSLGFSIPIFGVSLQWTPSPSERNFAKRTITFLENEGLLYIAFEFERPEDCYNSADKIRDGLTTRMEEIERETEVFKNADEIRKACADFMRNLQREKIDRIAVDYKLKQNQRDFFHQSLIGLRVKCGLHIAFLSASYGIDLDERLETILPKLKEK